MRNKQHWKKIIDSIDSTADSLDEISQKIIHKQNINKRLQRQKDNLENYKLFNIIGRGAFGEVRLAQNIGTNEIVAIKRLQKKRLLQKKQIYNAYLERDFMVNGTSSFLVQLKSAFQDDQYLYIAMQYVPGGDLLHLLIEKDILTEEQTRFYIAEMILGIQEIHNMNYIHRDIKPDNILIDKNGHVKISDFGLSKYLQKDDIKLKKSQLTKMQKIKKLNKLKARQRIFSKVGTPDYISPQVLTDSVYDHSVDIWGVGVIMFQCLFGYPPFTDDDSKQVCQRVINWVEYLEFPDDIQVSTAAKMLVLGMINSKNKRLTIQQIKKHSFFQSINWKKLHCSQAPNIPRLANTLDTSNFDDFEIQQAWRKSQINNRTSSCKSIRKTFNFAGFDYKHIPQSPLIATIKSLQKNNETKSANKQKFKRNSKKRLKTQQCQRSSSKRNKQNVRYSMKPTFQQRKSKTNKDPFNKSLDKQSINYDYNFLGASVKLKPFKKVTKNKIDNIKQAYTQKVKFMQK